MFLFITASRPVLGPTQPPIQWVPGALTLAVKRVGCEADHSLPSSAEVKYEWSYKSTPPTPSWRSSQLKKAQGQLYLTLIFTFTVFLCEIGSLVLKNARKK
jgi:hypothetical protein